MSKEISLSKQERLQELLAQIKIGNSEQEILKAKRDGSIPLSYSQEQFWFLDQLIVNKAAYNLPVLVSLEGDLDLKVLEESLNRLIQRHESLRSSFNGGLEQATQNILPDLRIKLSLMDLSQKQLLIDDDEFQSIIRQKAEEDFDLSQAPLFRFEVYRLKSGFHAILFIIHHIISDDWSMNIFFDELFEFYTAIKKNRVPELPELGLQYADYAIWQRQGQFSEKSSDYWAEALQNVTPISSLPLDYPRKIESSNRGIIYKFVFPESFSQELRAFAKEAKLTLFTIMLSAFQVLLYRYTQQSDIVVGVPFLNRNHPELMKLIGFFVNTLPIRQSISDELSFTEILAQCQQLMNKAFEHQGLPFEQIAKLSKVERNLSYNPLYQTTFQVLPAQNRSRKIADFELTFHPIQTGAAKLDFNLIIRDRPDTLHGWIEYNTDLFTESSIERFVEYYLGLLSEAIQKPNVPIQQLALTKKAELFIPTPISKPFETTETLHGKFSKQAKANPNGIALSYEDSKLSYAELEAQSNQLASYLLEQGIAPQGHIGLLLERSPDLLVAILAILKIGCAYVPLDSSYPHARLEYICQDAEVEFIIGHTSLKSILNGDRIKWIILDELKDVLSEYPDHEPMVVVPSNYVAYLIYTSGTSGKPKGTLIPHRNVLRLYEVTETRFRFNQEDVWTLFHSCAFDFSVWEIWGSLLYGGRLVVVPYWISRSPSAFAQLLQDEAVTILNQTPSAMYQLIAEPGFQAASSLSLRTVIFDGEVLHPQRLFAWYRAYPLPKPDLINMYGITETTIHVTYRKLSEADLEEGINSIGTGVEDWQLYILDKNLEPVPVGIQGELYVGGAGLGYGYLNQRSLTADRFIPNPFTSKEGERLYKTGDAGRYYPNGEIEYLGRIDSQVKIRGFRIELGDIETALLSYPDVQAAVVQVLTDEQGHKQIAAYVTERVKGHLNPEDLRAYLQTQLPSYMQPVYLQVLEQIPLTSNGKLNYQALPKLDQLKALAKTEYSAPQSPEELLLAEIWARVLQIEAPGIRDNFFNLGGDSIKSIQVVAEAKKVGLDLSIQSIFLYQTIEQIAKHSNSQASPTSNPKLDAFALLGSVDKAKLPENLEDAYPLTHLQLGMIFHSEYDKNSAYHNVTSMRVVFSCQPEIWEQVIAHIMRQHPILRSAFDLSNYTEALQLVFQDVAAPLTYLDWRQLSSEEQNFQMQNWLEAETKRYFDWRRPPLFRCSIHHLADREFQFTITEHHAILDGWSRSLLLTQLFQNYIQLVEGKALSPIENLPLFSQYVAYEQSVLQSESANYWRKSLEDFSPQPFPRWSDALPVPALELKSKTNTNNLRWRLSEASSHTLHEIARSQGVPMKTVLLAAHFCALGLLMNERDLLTGLVSHARLEQEGSENVLGLFLNTIPVRLQLKTETWLEFIKRVFATEHELLQHRAYPLVAIQKQLKRNRLFETAFNFSHFHSFNSLRHTEDFQLRNTWAYEQTNFPLMANFSQGLSSGGIMLDLTYNYLQIPDVQAQAILEIYQAALGSMVENPDAIYLEQ